MITWASRITDLRRKGMTLVEIGAAIDLSPSALSDIEKGRSGAPVGDAAVKLHELHKDKCSSGSVARAARA